MAPTTPINTSTRGLISTGKKPTANKFLDLSATEGRDESEESDNDDHDNAVVPAKRLRKTHKLQVTDSDEDVAPEDMDVKQLRAALKETNKSS